MPDLDAALSMIDAANAVDPNQVDAQPACLIYGQRMSAELARLFPEASDSLKIAARGQHIERWTLLRKDYPEGREGYLNWRKDLAKHHATRVGDVMAQTGYTSDDIDAATRMLLKQGIKRDVQVQALEDVICFVFLKWYFEPFSTKQDPEKMERIVRKTARKMSAEGRERVLEEFDLPVSLSGAFRD